MKENKSSLQTKTEGNTSTIRGKLRNHRNTELLQRKTQSYIETGCEISLSYSGLKIIKIN